MAYNVWDLKNIGKGKNCLIVGGGMSVLDMDFSLVPDTTVVIAINDSAVSLIEKKIKVDYTVYNDYHFLNRVNLKELSEKSIVICTNPDYSKTGVSYKCYASFFKELGLNLIDGEANTGAKAIVIANKVMNFDNIYLIGFDCNLKRNRENVMQSHFHGDEKLGDLLRSHVSDLTGRFIKEFNYLSLHVKNVYNLNRDSAIKCFPFLNIIINRS